MTITKSDLDNLVQFCYWYDEKEFISLWKEAGASQSLAEHLFSKFRLHDNGLDIAGFYSNLDKENQRRFVKVLDIYAKKLEKKKMRV